MSIFTETLERLMNVDSGGVSGAFIANTHTHTHKDPAAPPPEERAVSFAPRRTPPM